jgi:hypothetical protein
LREVVVADNETSVVNELKWTSELTDPVCDIDKEAWLWKKKVVMSLIGICAYAWCQSDCKDHLLHHELYAIPVKTTPKKNPPNLTANASPPSPSLFRFLVAINILVCPS